MALIAISTIFLRNILISEFHIFKISKCDRSLLCPESTLMPDGDEVYDKEEAAGYIVNITDS